MSELPLPNPTKVKSVMHLIRWNGDCELLFKWWWHGKT